jgi:hypothetical protein
MLFLVHGMHTTWLLTLLLPIQKPPPDNRQRLVSLVIMWDSSEPDPINPKISFNYQLVMEGIRVRP